MPSLLGFVALEVFGGPFGGAALPAGLRRGQDDGRGGLDRLPDEVEQAALGWGILGSGILGSGVGRCRRAFRAAALAAWEIVEAELRRRDEARETGRRDDACRARQRIAAAEPPLYGGARMQQQRRGGSMIVSVMYQVGDGHKFDLDYYLKVHMPLVGSLFGPAGLKEAQVLQGVGSPTGDPAGYHVITLLDFESADAFKAAADAHGAAVFGDIPNFTDVQPTVQFNERVG